MNKNVSILMALSFVLLLLSGGFIFSRLISSGPQVYFPKIGTQSAADRIFVKYKKQPELWLQSSAKIATESIYGLDEVEYFKFIDVYLYKTYTNKKQLLIFLSEDPNIVFAEPDYIMHAYQTIPNDPSWSSLWGFHNTGQTGGVADADIDAPEAWDITTGSSEVILGVIDTGVDYNHQDLMGNMWTNSGEIPSNGIDDDGNGYVDDYYGINAILNSGNPIDDNSHGTHCSGSIAAVGNNGIGVVGVCWTIKIMALKFLDENGSGYTSNSIKCIEYAINKGAHILSNSWGGGGFSQSLKDAIEAAKNADILFIAAAGNTGTNIDEIPFYPASYDSTNIIAVAASDHNDGLASFSNYGSISVDIAAPGVSIYSTLLNDSYGYKSGTSMATPIVAGTAALIKSNESFLTWQEIKDRILNRVDQKPAFQGTVLSGGRINAYNSLSAPSQGTYQLNIQSTT